MHVWLADTVRLVRLTLVRDGGARANPECGAGLRQREPNGALSRIATKNSKNIAAQMVYLVQSKLGKTSSNLVLFPSLGELELHAQTGQDNYVLACSKVLHPATCNLYAHTFHACLHRIASDKPPIVASYNSMPYCSSLVRHRPHRHPVVSSQFNGLQPLLR
jgi:hypothetical protein